MLAWLCARSQGQPPSGSRKRAMIPRSRAIGVVLIVAHAIRPRRIRRRRQGAHRRPGAPGEAGRRAGQGLIFLDYSVNSSPGEIVSNPRRRRVMGVLQNEPSLGPIGDLSVMDSQRVSYVDYMEGRISADPTGFAGWSRIRLCVGRHRTLRGGASDSAGIPGVRASDSAWPAHRIRRRASLGPSGTGRFRGGLAYRTLRERRSPDPAPYRSLRGPPTAHPPARPRLGHSPVPAGPTGPCTGRPQAWEGQAAALAGNRAGGSRWRPGGIPAGVRAGRTARAASGRPESGRDNGDESWNLGITPPRPGIPIGIVQEGLGHPRGPAHHRRGRRPASGKFGSMSIEAKIAAIHDEDLVAELEAAGAVPVRGHRRAHRPPPGPARRRAGGDRPKAGCPRRHGARPARRDAVRMVIEAEPVTTDTIQHIHSVLALCGLPYRDPARSGSSSANTAATR